MTASAKILIKATDQASAVLKRTADMTDEVANALSKLVVQDRNNKIMAEAQKQFANLTETEKKAALAAYDLAQAQQDVGQSAGGIAQIQNTWTELSSKINVAQQAIGAVVEVMKQAYAIGKEGAGLEYAATKFDRLSAAAKTTSDVLVRDLRKATGGMSSDAELMAMAGDMMSLGLVKTHDQIVRLSKVSSGLGMDMNELTLTLANQTTMRFDQLGVSVDGFDEKVKKLEKTGMSASDAFKEAFLQQAEAQLERVGGMAQTDAGKIARMEAATKNLGDAWKMSVAPSVADASEKLAKFLSQENLVRERMDKFDSGNVRENPRARLYRELAMAEYEASDAGQAYTNRLQAQADAEKQAADATTQAGQAAQSSSTNWYALAEAQSQAASNTMMQGYIDQTTQAIQNQSAALDDLLSKQASWASSTGNQVAGGLDQGKLSADDYEAALSVIDQTMGTNLRTQHEQKDAIDELNDKYNSGQLSLEDYRTGLKDINSEFDPFQTKIQSTREQLAALEAQLKGMEGTLTIDVSYSGGGGGGGGHPSAGGAGTDTGQVSGESWGATGLDFVVPQGYPNDSYRVNVQSGEHVQVTPPGQGTQSGVTNLTIGSIVLPNVTNPQQFLAELGQIAASKSRAGYQYAGKQ